MRFNRDGTLMGLIAESPLSPMQIFTPPLREHCKIESAGINSSGPEEVIWNLAENIGVGSFSSRQISDLTRF